MAGVSPGGTARGRTSTRDAGEKVPQRAERAALIVCERNHDLFRTERTEGTEEEEAKSIFRSVFLVFSVRTSGSGSEGAEFTGMI